MKFILILPLLAWLLSVELCGQAYCALRDPVREISTLYENLSGVRSVVRTVNHDVRKEMSTQLPEIKMYLSELGRHTLYFALEGEKVAGLVHPRSESSESGLVDVVWSLDLNFRITSFTFQRCRSSQRGMIEAAKFVDQLRGKSFDQLRSLLSKDGKSLAPGKLVVSSEAESLAVTVIRCGLKTTLLTKLVWGEDVAKVTPPKKNE